MNYFSHYFVDSRDGLHAYNTGLILPDITRKQVRKFIFRDNYSDWDIQFYEGCKAHYEADKQFHASIFFKSILEKATFLINEVSFSNSLQRKWFLAHILAELMIDRILVKHKSEELNGFYYSLNAIDDGKLKTFLQLNGMEQTDMFFNFFNHFRKVQYIYYYADNNKFVYSLNRIMIQAGVGALSGFDERVLLQVALKLEQELSVDVNRLLEQLIESKTT